MKDGIIYASSWQTPGSGEVIGNTKDGYVYSSCWNYAGSGNKVCAVSEVTIPGMEREYDEMIVAVYHFLIKKFL